MGESSNGVAPEITHLAVPVLAWRQGDSNDAVLTFPTKYAMWALQWGTYQGRTHRIEEAQHTQRQEKGQYQILYWQDIYYKHSKWGLPAV